METINGDVKNILIYCGFKIISNREEIDEDGFESFEDIMSMTEKDIGNISKVFLENTAVTGRIIFGLRPTNILRERVLWVQEF